MTTTLNTLEKGKFPAQAQPNPQVYKQSQVHSVENEDVKPVKAVITLRSGKQIERPDILEQTKPRSSVKDDCDSEQRTKVLENVTEPPKAQVHSSENQQKENEPGYGN